MNWSALVLPALGTAGVSFPWLLAQTITRRRAGWVSSVVLPAVLAGFTGATMRQQIAPLFAIGGTGRLPIYLLALSAAVAAGFLFDRDSSLQRDEGGITARRSPWPLMLWGLGSTMFVSAP